LALNKEFDKPIARRIIFDFTISICSIRIFDHCNIQSIFAYYRLKESRKKEPEERIALYYVAGQCRSVVKYVFKFFDEKQACIGG